MENEILIERLRRFTDADLPPTESNGNGHGPMQAPAREIPRIPLVTFEELALRPRLPVRFLVGRHVVAGESTLVSARERSYKSFVTMEWATAVALGRSCLGQFDVDRPESVILFDLENKPGRLCDRVEAKLRRDGLDAHDFGGRLIIFDRDNAPDRWRFNAISLAGLGQAIETYQPALVVIDNLRKATPAGKDEKDGKDMLPIIDGLVELCDQTETALILVHHDRRDGSGFSGSGVLVSSPANYIQVKKDRQSGVAVINCDSMRNAEPFEPFAVVMGKDGALRLTEVPEQDEPSEPASNHGVSILKALDQGGRTIAELAAATSLSERQVRPVVKRLLAAEVLVELGDRETSAGVRPMVYGRAATPF